MNFWTTNNGQRPTLPLFIFIFILTFITAFLPAQTTPTLRVSSELFRVGYLQRESTGHWGEESLEVLRRALEADGEVRAELTRAGYGHVGLFACDGPADMVRRLNAREFDLAFTPANIYGEQQAGYTAVLKARRPEDIPYVNPGGYGAIRKGIVFVSPRATELFGKKNLTPEQMRDALSRERLAVVSTQSVAGFNAPLLELVARYGRESLESGYIYFDNSEEVVKGVLSGLADVGACEQSALERVLERYEINDERGELVEVLLETLPVVTDPVVVRESLAPRYSPLGRKLRDKIRTLSLERNLAEVQYVPSNDDEYRRLIELLKEFNERVGEVVP